MPFRQRPLKKHSLIYKPEDARNGDQHNLWECGEYVPDADCTDRSNFWKVVASARRTGRYIAKRKTVKLLLEGPKSDIN